MPDRICRISDIKIGKRFRKDLGDIDGLARDIEEIGLLQPVVVDENNNLVAGLRRIRACEMLGWEKIPVRVVNLEDLVRGEYSENEKRKNWTPSEAVAVANELKMHLTDTTFSLKDSAKRCSSLLL